MSACIYLVVMRAGTEWWEYNTSVVVGMCWFTYCWVECNSWCVDAYGCVDAGKADSDVLCASVCVCVLHV